MYHAMPASRALDQAHELGLVTDHTDCKHTWRKRDAMNSFVLAQLHAVGSGAAHHAPAWAPWQRALMAASSSAYLANAVCWSQRSLQ